jgi:hypothetical protein
MLLSVRGFCHSDLFLQGGFSKMLRNRLSNRTTGIYCLVIGVIIAIAGVYFWTSGHGTRGPVLLVVAVVVLAFGGYAFMASSKKPTSTR